MKKHFYSLLIPLLFFIFLFSFDLYRTKDFSLKSAGYLSHFKQNKGYYFRQFQKKMKGPLPLWMQKQINEDFTLNTISLKALEATQQTIQRKQIVSTNRYRIVNQTLYKYFDPLSFKVQQSWADAQKATVDWFEKGIQTLLALTSIPDIDFIVTHDDGTRFPFHCVEDIALQAPLLGWAKLKSTPFLILIPDWRSLSTWWYDDIRKLKEGKNYQGDQIPWEKKKPLAFWRGGDLKLAPYRRKLALLSQDHPEIIDAGLTAGKEPSLQKPFASYEEHLEYKYLPILDGIMCSYPGYQWRLLSDSLPLKQESEEIQWFYKGLTPFVHYLPIKQDLSDLLEKIKWAQEHDDLCQQMAKESTDFALKFLMFDDVYCYFAHVLKTYHTFQDLSLKQDLKRTSSNDVWIPLF